MKDRLRVLDRSFATAASAAERKSLERRLDELRKARAGLAARLERARARRMAALGHEAPPGEEPPVQGDGAGP